MRFIRQAHARIDATLYGLTSNENVCLIARTHNELLTVCGNVGKKKSNNFSSEARNNVAMRCIYRRASVSIQRGQKKV